MIDVIVPVYNQAHILRLCLSSLLGTKDNAVDKLICVLDGCDSHTAALARDMLSPFDRAVIVELEKNLGFLQACNAGFALSESEIAVLVNSDTCATPGWTSAIESCFASDDRIGIASPLSNFCPHNTVPMPPGMNYLEVADLIRSAVAPRYPDLTTCEGFFFAVRRACRREIGVFDVIFDRGYCEESDLCMRANYHGWRTVLIDNLYIFHFGRQTFGTEQRDEFYNRNKRVFFDRWNPTFAERHDLSHETSGLKGIRESVGKTAHLDLPPVRWV